MPLLNFLMKELNSLSDLKLMRKIVHQILSQDKVKYILIRVVAVFKSCS